MYIDLLKAYRQQLSKLEREIDQLAAQLEEYELIQSLPGIGEKSRLRYFQKLGKLSGLIIQKLVAFAGLDPNVFESGRFKGTKITLTNVAQLDFVTCFTQPFAVRFEIAVKENNR